MQDPMAIELFIGKLCQITDAIQYGPPQIMHFGIDDKEGYSFVQLLTASSLTGHLSDKTRQVFIDMFYCKSYDPQKAADYCKEFFKAQSMDAKAYVRT